MGGKGGTPLLKAQQAECSQCWKWWEWDVLDYRRGHFHSLRAILCEADGRGTLCHLVVGNPQRTCEVAGLTLCPSPLSLCQQNFPATHSFCTCTQPFRNRSIPVSRAPPACGLKGSSPALGMDGLVFRCESHSCSWCTL